MNELTIGQMSSLNCVSERTLRVYDEKGLLKPKRNETTGYRRYDIGQCSTLDAIQQLQMIGFSLDEIKDILDEKYVYGLENQLAQKETEALDHIAEMQRSLRMIRDFRKRCAIIDHLPETGVYSIETLPERHALRFNVKNEDMFRDDLSSEGQLAQWQLSICMLKRELLEKGYPLSYFRSVACVIPQEQLISKKIVYSQAFVFVDADDTQFAAETETVPGGRYLTMYCNDLSCDEGILLETVYLRQMLDYIEEQGYQVVGDYVGEVVLDTDVFLYSGRDELVKMQVPIA